MSTPVALPVAPPGVSFWVHEDGAGISAAAARGVARAESGDWTSGDIAVRVADFRGYLVYRSWLAAKLAGKTGTSEEKGAFQIDPDWITGRENAASSDRARALMLLGKTGVLMRLAANGTKNWDAPALFSTNANSADVGALPLMAIAIVTVVVAVAESAAVAYLAHEARAVVENWLARDSQLKSLAQADAQVLRVLDDHADREATAGANLPLDDAERRALDMLDQRQKDATAKLTAPAAQDDSNLGWWAFGAGLAAAAAAALLFR